MEIFYMICSGLTVLVFVMAIERLAIELRGIRTVLMEHAQLEPVPVREHDPVRYQRKNGNPPVC